MTEPRTEAGRRLLERLGWFASEKGDALREGILAIEAEAAAGPRDVLKDPAQHAFEMGYARALWNIRHGKEPDYAEAAAGPLDEGLREALDLADYRLGQLLGNTDADDDALRAIRKARAALAKASE